MAEKICKDCGYRGSAKKQAKGKFGNEVALWLLGILFLLIFLPVGILILAVGILYSLYRMFAPCDKICPQCSHSNTMIPIDSPIGQQMIKNFQIKGDGKNEKTN